MNQRVFERAFSKKFSYEEDFDGGPIFNQDHDAIEIANLEHEPKFLYHIDYDFSCDVDVWGRVATHKVEVGSIGVTCLDLRIGYRVHDFADVVQKDLKAAEKFYMMIEKRIEEKYAYGIHTEEF